ncbi:potassium-transporting ATPase subunit KdpA [Brevundimonas diminuta]|jgi:K+-transporting ATPase ATPase A chain|uniref:Potassium-transporting ATPase potassium-binding subunit n=1 Tax=Brevundimonas diminuta TaxID=293 RepID=A0A3D4DGP3_BREDI|nr:potassium-transporting ATPase subunit KdpA [Brevundimonas diminuta]OJU51334.1 MAG: potassium-transporting ATPase subunit KdpA [Brevundimonas sp. 67-6]MBD3572623.1 potassium-transporting ATPase subunit KdpA [Brevundimonas diminuta]QAT15146.1 potassium-transporting ATPase subunit KdpA [Brevundimonas diminuta]QQB87470.1 potassium-transporting ATPase subunit KdpA [Brevundimonas diminuta]GEC01071.1 potassium-transporting ATPase potassium-binding subunit [Brevundimonas diminuta]
MNIQGWAEIALTLGLAVMLGWPIGVYMSRVWNGERTWLDPVLKPVEGLFYRAAGVDPTRSQGWLGYAGALLAFNLAGFLLLYAMLRLQGVLPMNPQGFDGVSPHLAFNTAVSFVTNTNWQSYSGETTVSTFSQMVGLTVQNFVSAATGATIAAALARAFIASRGEGVGNFWADLTRTSLYVLLPIAFIVAVALAGLGVVQSLAASAQATTLEGGSQTISLFPTASQLAIKQLGINGGGVFGVNSAHPLENPTPLTNLITAISVNVLGWAAFFAFGRSVLAKKDVRALVVAAILLLGAAGSALYVIESQPAPALVAAGVDTSAGNMEGKEVRFGVPSSVAWAAQTTGASNGSVNSMHASYMPLGGAVTMFLMQLGEILPGGIGSGVAVMVLMAMLAVFVAGLMVGRTPEYLGKKIEAREIQFAMLVVLVVPLSVLGFSAAAAVLPEALASLLNKGPHGLSEILYAYTSATGNNGSAFGGLSANTPWWNTTLGLAMLLGRFVPAVAVLAVAGALVAKPRLAPSVGTLPTHGPLFIGLLIGVILILGGLQFFPALSLGPIVEHFDMLQVTARF